MSYYLLTEETAIAYAREKLPQFKEGDFNCKEIGDGNLNYVFRIWQEGGPSVIIKQAGDLSRLSKVPYSRDRNRIEAEIMKRQGEYATGFVPEIYFYDDEMTAMAMEDMTGYTVMRTSLNEGVIFPTFAEDITDYLVGILLKSSDLVIHPKDKKEAVKFFTNPELCDITERFIFTDPYLNGPGRNPDFEPNRDFVKKEIYDDTAIHAEAAKMKYIFMTKAESLLHGDLHTGSIFVKEGSTKVFDAEFGFYGPMGFDIGLLMANLMFAHARATCAYVGNAPKDEYLKWLEDTIVSIPELFKTKFIAAFNELCADPMLKTKGYAHSLLGDIMSDTAGMCGAELIRRTVGLAGVADLRAIEDIEARAVAERKCVMAGKRMMTYRFQSMSGQDYLDAMEAYVG